MTRRWVAGLAVAAAGAASAVAVGIALRPGPGLVDAPPTVVLVVLDTVRADHLSACGYGRPTSPFLASLATEGALRCDAVAPASWTVASHASFFTGLPVDTHGAMFREGGEKLHNNIHVRPLEDRFETLAERFARAGYTTAFFSGNPVLHDGSGLTQGFQIHAVKAPDGGWLRAGRLHRVMRTALSEVDPSRPLFLVVNIFEAHDPWPPAEPEIDWAPRHERVVLRHDQPDSSYVRFHHDALPPDDREAYLATVTDAYDVALWRADQTLSSVVTALREDGWLSRPYRLVVTSDHGELLGEHGRLRHGGNVYEGNLRVPFLWVEPQGKPRLEGLLGAIDLHDILAYGTRPPSGEVWSFTEPAQMHPSPGVWGVARYAGQEKEVHTSDGDWVVDFDRDPEGQELPSTTAEAALIDRLRALEQRAEAPFEPIGDGDEEALRELGYVE